MQDDTEPNRSSPRQTTSLRGWTVRIVALVLALGFCATLVLVASEESRVRVRYWLQRDYRTSAVARLGRLGPNAGEVELTHAARQDRDMLLRYSAGEILARRGVRLGVWAIANSGVGLKWDLVPTLTNKLGLSDVPSDPHAVPQWFKDVESRLRWSAEGGWSVVPD